MKYKKPLIYTLIIIFLVVLVNKGCFPKIPSDQELIDNFIKNEKDFKKLVRMFSEDKNTFFVDRWYDKKENISKERHEKYLEMFDKLNITSIGNYGQIKNKTGFMISYDYHIISGDYKGYSFFLNGRKPYKDTLIVDNIEKYHKIDNIFAARHIKDNWYIYYFANY